MEKNFKYGFSLAEAMIMLTIVSIIMAVSVPLIAKKAQVDTRTLLAHSTYNAVAVNGVNTRYRSSTSGVFGDNNAFGIGIKKAVAKLHIRGVAAQNNHTNDASVIFRADVQNDNNAAGAVYHGFKVYGDGSTNVRACVPDYTAANMTIIYSANPAVALGATPAIVDANGVFQTDGYIIVTGGVYTMNNAQTLAPSFITQDIAAGNTTVRKISDTIVPVSIGSTILPNLPANITFQDIAGNALNQQVIFAPCLVTPSK